MTLDAGRFGRTRSGCRATYTVEEAATLLGIGRTLAYDLIRRGEFPVPVIRLGARRIVVPRVPLDEMLGRGA
jgi:excisionase family DNA binding protein